MLFSVIDLFAGPGGLGEGFSGFTESGRHPFSIRLSAENDRFAQQTLELRSFVREFRDGKLPDAYFRFLRGELSRDELFALHPKQAAVAREHSQPFELGEANRTTLESRIRALKLDPDSTVVVGGPPCQAYSVAGRSRNGAKKGWKLETDSRSTLYREYLHCLAITRPAAFVMENVRGMLSARMNGESVISRVLDDLQDPARAIGRQRSVRTYRVVPVTLQSSSGGTSSLPSLELPSPEDYLVRAENHGVPQARHRVILLGLAVDRTMSIDGRRFLTPVSDPQTVRSAIGDLPKLRSGLTGNGDFQPWADALTSFLRPSSLAGIDSSVRDLIRESIKSATSRKRAQYKSIVAEGPDGRMVLNHAARSHMQSDLHRYVFASAWATVHGKSPTLDDFPVQLLPEHANVTRALNSGAFSDRFRVQRWDAPSTTVVSHISKDGHYYIHPDPAQCRSLTVREAARLQTFPDNYVFCGPRTAQFHQVGNAVPVALARQIAALVFSYLR